MRTVQNGLSLIIGLLGIFLTGRVILGFYDWYLIGLLLVAFIWYLKIEK